MVLQISQVSCNQDALRGGKTTLHPPQCVWACRHSSKTVQPTFPPQCSGKYQRGGNVRTRRPLRTRKACMCRCPTPKRSAAGGWIYCISAGAQDSQLQTFPRGSDELNFVYHVRACRAERLTAPRTLSCTTCLFPQETLLAWQAPGAFGLLSVTCTHWHHHCIILRKTAPVLLLLIKTV